MPSNVSWAFTATCSPFIFSTDSNIRILKIHLGSHSSRGLCTSSWSQRKPGAGWSRTGVIDMAQGERGSERAQNSLPDKEGCCCLHGLKCPCLASAQIVLVVE